MNTVDSILQRGSDSQEQRTANLIAAVDTADSAPALLTAAQVVTLFARAGLDISAKTVKRYARDGKLSGGIMAGAWRVKPESVSRYLATQLGLVEVVAPNMVEVALLIDAIAAAGIMGTAA